MDAGLGAGPSRWRSSRRLTSGETYFLPLDAARRAAPQADRCNAKSRVRARTPVLRLHETLHALRGHRAALFTQEQSADLARQIERSAAEDDASLARCPLGRSKRIAGGRVRFARP